MTRKPPTFGSKVLGTFLLLVGLMAIYPHLASDLIAVMLMLSVLVFALCLMAALAKGFAILGIEVWFVRWLYKRR